MLVALDARVRTVVNLEIFMQAKNYAAQILTDTTKGKIVGTILDKCSDDKQVATRRIQTIAEGLKSAIHFNLPDFGTILGNERKGEMMCVEKTV